MNQLIKERQLSSITKGKSAESAFLEELISGGFLIYLYTSFLHLDQLHFSPFSFLLTPSYLPLALHCLPSSRSIYIISQHGYYLGY